MLYLFRTHTLLNLFYNIFLWASIFIGGWLLARTWFQLRPSERVMTGLALGITLDIFLANLIGKFFSLDWASWIAPTLLLLSGFWSYKTAPKEFSRAEIQPALRHLAILLSMTLLFWGILRGNYLFDDYFHLPLISSMAAGNFPLQFHLNADLRLDYHYGLHIIAAGMIRWGGLSVWGIWDGIRALTAALTLILLWQWGRRISRKKSGGWIVAGFFAFGSGTRWLLLLLPKPLVAKMSADLTLLGTAAATGPDLLANLTRGWAISGLSPLPVPFAFINGFWYPVTLAWGGSSSLPLLMLTLLLMIYPHKLLQKAQVILIAMLLSAYALVSESRFLYLMAGMGLVWVLQAWDYWKTRNTYKLKWLRQWAGLAVLVFALAMMQGGVLTGIAAKWFLPAQEKQHFGFAGFTLRFPPAFTSGHLGALSLTNPYQTLLALLEMGPAILLLPLLAWMGWHWLRRADRAHLEAGLAWGALAGFVLPLFLRYGVERDLARLFSTALVTAALLLLPRLWDWLPNCADWQRTLFWTGYALSLFAGVVVFGMQILSIKTPLYSNFIQGPDAYMAQRWWNTLPSDTIVLDRKPPRAVTVLGRLTRSNQETYKTRPEWEELLANLTPQNAAAQGFDFIYMDGQWWSDLNAARTGFDDSCVQMIEMPSQPFATNARWLIDIRGCR